MKRCKFCNEPLTAEISQSGDQINWVCSTDGIVAGQFRRIGSLERLLIRLRENKTRVTPEQRPEEDE